VKKRLVVMLFLVLLLFAAHDSFAVDSGLWLSYGFGALNVHKRIGRIEGGRNYDFFQLGYIWERPCHFRQLALVFEPFAAYVNRPDEGVDVGLNASLKFYFLRDTNQGPYITAGTGMAYTTTGFKEQGTHLLFMLQMGLGFRYKQFFIEDRLRHYSNGRTSSPNNSVHANVLMVGMYF
jgi:hypothetical protein